MMRTRISQFIGIFGVIFLLIACTHNSQGDSAPTQISTITTPFSTETIITTTDIRSADYMTGCLELNPNRHQEQISFQGIYPGKTSKNESLELLGFPKQVYEGYGSISSSAEYDKFSLDFDKKEIVMFIFYSARNKTLMSSIMEFGCPNIIFTGYVVMGGQWTSLVYYDLGLQIEVEGFPVLLDNDVNIITYYRPTTWDGYLKGGLGSEFEEINIISWNDAILK